MIQGLAYYWTCCGVILGAFVTLAWIATRRW